VAPPTGGNGALLYANNCASCHGTDGNGGTEEDVRGESAEEIKEAIDEEDEMNFLSSLTNAEIELIAEFLAEDEEDDDDDGEHDDGEHDDGEHGDGEHGDGEHGDGEHGDDEEYDDDEDDEEEDRRRLRRSSRLRRFRR